MKIPKFNFTINQIIIVMKKIIFITLFITTLCFCSKSFAADYYWVGGTGNWSEFGTHWATTSGGSVFHLAEPGPDDDVYFNTNSFSGAGEVVAVDVMAYCKTMDWAGITNNPDFTGGNNLDIYGSIIFDPGMTASYTGWMNFLSNNAGNVLNFSTVPLSIGGTNFNGNGDWTFMSDMDLSLSGGGLQASKGTVNTNGYTISVDWFDSWTTDNRTIIFGNSTININWNLNLMNVSTLTFNAGTSTINLSSNWFDGMGLTYYDVNFVLSSIGEVQIQGSNTFHTLGFDNSFVTGVVFMPSETNTIYDLDFGATCSNRKTIKSQNDGETTTIKKLTGTVTEDYLNIKDITVIGGATFITNNGVDMGNVVNWTINSSVPTNYYWVGGTGNWSDTDHWSTISGGPYPSGETCVPTDADNVFFDANSFTAPGEIVTVDVIAFCNSMDWTGVTNIPDFANGWPSELNIYSSLTLDAGMTISYSSSIYFRSDNPGNTITTAGLLLNSYLYFNGVGDWTLQDDLTCSSIYLNKGYLMSNDNDITGSQFQSGSGMNRQLDLGSSIVTLSSIWWIDDNTNMILNTGTSTIITGGWSFYGGGFTYNDVTFTHTTATTIFNSNTFNTLTLSGGDLNLEQGQTQVLNDLIATGDCSDLLNIKSYTVDNISTISKTVGIINVDYVALQDVTTIGGATFNANNSIDLGNNSGWNFTFLASTDYYWIGGAGNWSDPNNWSLTSGGVSNPSGCLPTQVDNVYFDGNSGLNLQTVTIDQIAYCHDMDWTGVSANANMNGISNLNVYGSYNISAITNYWFSGKLYLKSNNIGNIINTGGKTLNHYVYFDGAGEWTLLSNFESLVSNSKNIYFDEGSIITNNFNITTNYFYSTTDKIRLLSLGSSVVDVTGWGISNGTNLTVIPGTSTITVNTSGYVQGGNQPYNDFNINATSAVSIYGGNTFNNLNIPTATSIKFDGGLTQTFNTLVIPSGTNCNDYINIGTITSGVVANLSMPAGIFNGNWLIISDLTASGSGTFNATNSIEIGDVTGWNITSPTPVDLYWIGDGGDWNDPLHWSLLSGGPSYGCIPTSEDNVFFDVNSFTAPLQIVNINVEGYCKNMDWTGVTNNPKTQGWSQLNINGSLTLNPAMAFNYSGTINFNSNGLGNTLTSAGHIIYGILFSGSGEYTLLDNLTLEWSGITFNNGTLNTNNFDLDITNGSFISNSTSTRTLNLGSSIITVSSWEIQDNTNLVINAGTSEISTSLNSWIFNGGDMAYNNVTIINPTWNDVEIQGSNTFNILIINPGSEVIFEEGTTQTTTDFQATGNAGDLVHIHTTTIGTQAFINQTSHEFCSDYMNIQDISVGPQTFYAGDNSIDLGNNTGWTWSGVTAIDQYPAALCEDIPGSGTYSGINLTLLETTIDGGNAYTHTWYSDPSLISPVISPSSVTVSNGQIFYDEVDNGICTNIAEVIYSVTSPVLSFNVTDVLLCNGDMTGAIDLTVTSATLPITYDWSNSDVTEDLVGVIAGSYTVTVTDINSCTISGGDVINQPLAISIDTEAYTDITCHNDNDGTITVTASGGTGALIFDNGVSGPQATGNFSSLAAGTYTVSVTDINMCSETSTPFIIDNPSAISIDSEAYTNITCHDDNDGTITVTTSGGTGVLSYDIGTGPQATGVFSGLATGTYTVTVTDVNMCSEISSSIVIANPSVISIDSEAYTDITCHNDNDGTITVTASGGTGALNFDIGAGTQGTGNFSGLTAGTYTVTVTDINSCSETSTSFVIFNPTTISIDSEAYTDITCHDDNDGTITVTASGGTGALIFDNGVSGPQATGNFSSLAAGTYTVTVTDINMCSETSTPFVINNPSVITIDSEAYTDITCHNDNDGTLTITASGSTGTLSYDIGTGPQATGVFSGLAAGTYTVTVTDINMCSETSSSFIIDNPLTIDITELHTDVSTCGGADGSIDITSSGGTGLLYYAWTGPASFSSSVDDINALIAGAYILVVSDDNSCTNTITVPISEVGAPTISMDDQTNILCYGECTGDATVSAIGGVTPYNYTWSNSDTGPYADDLCAGVHSVTLIDANICSSIINVTITEPIELLATHIITNETCYSACDGTATITATGGTGALDYDIGTGIQLTGNFLSLCFGNYNYTVTDINSCEYIDNFTILPYDMAGTISGTNPLCNSDCNGDATIVASAGSGTYSYSWSTLETTPTISNLCDGLYSVIITDLVTGCTLEKSIDIIEPDLLSLALSSTIDSGIADGTATVVVTGGTPPYNYFWDDPIAQTTALATALSAGNWTVNVTDDNGCTETGSVTVDLLSTVNDITILTQVKLFPNPSDGLLNFDIRNCPDDELSIIVYSVNGQIIYSDQYKLVNGELIETIDLSNQSSGMYYLKIVSDNLNLTEKIVLENK
jgi:DNA/RNA endonuclease YhcR with UshA esterase domain